MNSFALEEVTSVYLPLKTNMDRIIIKPVVRLKKLIICQNKSCGFVAGARGGRKNCPACLKPYE